MPDDDVKARFWFKQAAQRGQPDAMRNLDILYAGGRTVPVSPQTAARYLLAAERLGSLTTRPDLDWDMRT